MHQFDLVTYFWKGGFFMWPLLLCSILGVAVILERSLVFTLLWLRNPQAHQAGALLRQSGVPAALAALKGQTHPLAAVMRTYLDNLGRPAELRLELVKAEGSLQLERVEKRLRVLATISHLAPLIGLLGTVTGLVIAFASMQELGAAARPADLAGGIWEALLTTVFGLIVAIPCMAAFHGFEGLADQLARDLQRCVVELDGILDDSTLSGAGGRLSISDPEATEDTLRMVG